MTTGGDDGPDMEPVRANQVPPQATRARESAPVAAREREPAPAAEVDAGSERASGRGEDFTRIRLRGDPPATPSTPPPFDQLPPRLQEGLLARAASSLSGGSGQPLPPELRDAIDATVGRPPDPSVRVRQSPASELAATRLGARAFTIGRDIHLGPTASRADDRLLLHEAVHTMQQGEAPRARGVSRVEGAHERNAASVVDAIERGAAATVLSDAPAVVFRDVIDDVRNKLSYKLLDWAVTDADAEQSLALLNSIPDATLAVQIARLEDKYVTRLLDNLPDRDKTGPQYTRIIQALGPRTAGFVENRLSRGLFDWAVTDEDAGDVFNVFANYTPVQQDQFMESLLDRKRLATLIANATG